MDDSIQQSSSADQQPSQKTQSATQLSVPVSTPQVDKHTPVWLVILLFLVFQPAALFIIFKEKYYHGWLAILLWLYAIPLFLTYLVMRISVIPQLEILYKSLNIPNSIPIINSIIILFMVFLLAQIIFGIVLFKRNRLAGYLSKKLLIIALLFFIMDLFVSPGFIIIGIVKPIYNLTSSIGESTTPKTTQFFPAPTIAPISNWKIYTNDSGKYSISYPPNWTTKEQPISNSKQTPKETSSSFMVMPPVDKTLEFPPIISIEVFANPEDLSEKDFIVKYISLVPQDTVIKEVTVDNKKGVIVSLPGAVENDNVLIKYNGNIYKITLDHSLIKEKDIDNKLFNQILSTFRFAN